MYADGDLNLVDFGGFRVALSKAQRLRAPKEVPQMIGPWEVSDVAVCLGRKQRCQTSDNGLDGRGQRTGQMSMSPASVRGR